MEAVEGTPDCEIVHERYGLGIEAVSKSHDLLVSVLSPGVRDRQGRKRNGFIYMHNGNTWTSGNTKCNLTEGYAGYCVGIRGTSAI